MRTLTMSRALGALLIVSNPALASEPVPMSEPSTLALFAIGVVAVIIGRRFYRNK